MKTRRYLALPLKALLTGALSGALIVSGSAFSVLPELPPAATPAAENTARDVDPVPVERWTEQPPPAPVPSGVDATAAPAPIDAAIGESPTANTVALQGKQPARVPMMATVPSSGNGTSNFTAVPGVGSGSWGTTGQTGGFTLELPLPDP
ncbi:hypothetical protein AAHB34_20330 [Paenarthrobacter ureafaciens]